MRDLIWYLNRHNFIPSIQAHARTLPKTEHQSLLSQIEMRPLKRGEIVCFPGESSRYTYLLKEGHVRISRITPGGRTLALDILDPGHLFGEISLCGQTPRQEVAIAMSPALICKFPRGYIESLVRSDPEFALRITKAMGDRLLKIENRMEDMLFCPVPVRLARLLLSLSDRYPVLTDEGCRGIDLPLTHQEIGELIGANRETVTARLGQFRKEALIASHRHRIVLLDEARLLEKSKQL